MMSDRRRVLAAATALLAIGTAGAGYAYRRLRRHRNELDLLGDDGNPLISFRVPGRLRDGLETLPGTTVLGAKPEAKATLYEFFDYNCPECRLAARDLILLARGDSPLRIVLVNNPIVSQSSMQAAGVTIAARMAYGSEAAAGLYVRLFTERGRADAARALEVAEALGLPRARLERLMAGDDVRQVLQRQMTTATELGLFATPAFVLGDAGIIGHPGPETLTRMGAAMQACDRVACG